MSQWIEQASATTVKLGPFLDEDDGKTTEEALAIAQADIRLTKNGGAFAQSNNAAGGTHDENGYYGIPLDATDTGTLGTLRVSIHEAGALPVWQDFMIVPTNVWDSMFGADKLQVHAAEITAGLITAAAIATDAVDADALAADALVEIKAQSTAALSDIALDHLLSVADGDDVANDSVIGQMTATDGDWSNFAKATDSLQAARDNMGSAVAASISADIAAIKAETAVIEGQTDDIGVAGAGLTDLGGMSVGMKAEVQTECDASLVTYDAPTDAEMNAAHALLATPAQVNTQVSDVMKTDTIAQLAQQLPPSTPTFEEAVMYIYQYFRNKRTESTTEIKMYAEDEATVIAKSTISDAAAVFTKGEFATGP